VRGAPPLVAAIAVALGVAPSACRQGAPAPAAQPQVVLYVDTDAPVAHTGYPAIGPGDLIPLFDHVRIDVYAPGATSPCSGCSNDFDVDAESFLGASVSLGVVFTPGAVVRVRLTWSAFVSSAGEPNAMASLDTFVALPDPAGGVIAATVALSTEDVGRTIGSTTSPVTPSPGPPSASQVGSWSGAQRASCATAPPPGQVCVPGGAFWLGPRGDHLVNGTLLGFHRITVVSPFFLDATEVTVAAARSGHLQGALAWSGATTGTEVADWCTFTVSPGPRDALPVNCVTAGQAQELCKGRGGDLPSEAQFEYVASGMNGRRFVWGNDDPFFCDDDVWGRNGFGIQAAYVPQQCISTSVMLDAAGSPMGGPSAPGWSKRDVLSLPTGSVVDLAGNVSEWARDVFQPQSGSCWSGGGVMRDPVCTQPSPGASRLTVPRGGSWSDGGTWQEASYRSAFDPESVASSIGFRCQRAGGS